MKRQSTEAGMSLAELAVAMGLLLVLVSSLFSAFRPADGLFTTQTEAADMQQRLRAALDALRRDLSAAGSGGSADRDGGPMTFTAPAVLPRRIGLRGSDAPDVFRADAITVLQASPLPAVDSRIAQPMTASSDVTGVFPAPGCPPLDPQCGIDVDDDVLVADDGGAFD
jgi:Tfp pilus assembly protein PilW